MPDLIDLARRLVDAARAAGASDADAIVAASSETAVGVRAGALEEAERSESVDLGLRAFAGDRQACVSASDARPETIAALAERAVAMAREAPEDPHCALPAASNLGDPPDAAPLALASDDGADPETLEAAAREAEAAALAVSGVSQVESASASWRRVEIALAASNGFAGGYARSSAGLSVSAIAGEGLGMEGDYDFAARRGWSALPSPAEIGRSAGERAAARLGAKKPPTGPVAVVFDRRIAPSLMGHILSAANGSAVARGASWLSERMGEQILPDWADLLEDPLEPGAPASRPFDGEGVASMTAPVVRGGRLERWLLDCATARRLGLSTTANARRGTGGPPSPGSTNIRFRGGEGARDALLAEAGRGFLVTGLMGSSVNPTTGAYSRGASGFWFERGEIVHPVSEATIAGSLPDFLPKIRRAADDGDPHLSMSVPSLLIDGLVVAGG